MKVKVIHGPNLNMLGIREPDKYGTRTLDDINESIASLARELKIVEVVFFQSNSESAIIDEIHSCHQKIDGVLINPAAFGHTSIALRDAFLSASTPFVEVHFSNIYAREEFRHKSFLTDIAIGVVSGFGDESYMLGLRALHHSLLKVRA
ncbi:MAG: type II 3-dehydroquinate dehydratase [Candidatus Obscuribacterales bacterium]|nr:type II 3-dehydroquinate dehydratase [Candidatus Obscuribacterales bacterium]